MAVEPDLGKVFKDKSYDTHFIPRLYDARCAGFTDDNFKFKVIKSEESAVSSWATRYSYMINSSYFTGLTSLQKGSLFQLCF